MKAIGRWAATIGLVVAAWLVAREGLAPVVQTLRVAGFGLVLAAGVHLLPLLLNARGWHSLFVKDARSFSTITIATWVREAVNGLLPVARIGGEVAAYRLLVAHGVAPVSVAVSLVIDMVLSMLSQGLFALVGLCLAVHLGLKMDLTGQLGAAVVVLLTVGTGCAVLPRWKSFVKAVEAIIYRISQRWRGIDGRSAQFDARMRAVWGHRRAVVMSFLWQCAGWLAGAAEVWVALWLFGHPGSVEVAVLIEAFIQSVSSVAFLVPGALGVQEGAFLLIGGALGFDGATSLALAASRRIRDLMFFLPGLIAWYQSEWRERTNPAVSIGSPTDVEPSSVKEAGHCARAS